MTSGKGCIEEESELPYPQLKDPVIGPARAGSNILENKVLSKLTGDVKYVRNATRAWAPLVWNKLSIHFCISISKLTLLKKSGSNAWSDRVSLRSTFVCGERFVKP